MLQVAKRACQVKNAHGKLVTIDKGQVVDVPELSVHCNSLEEEHEINFLMASEEELLAADWMWKDAKDLIFKTYGVRLRKAKKEKMAAQIMDIRYRAADIVKED